MFAIKNWQGIINARNLLRLCWCDCHWCPAIQVWPKPVCPECGLQ